MNLQAFNRRDVDSSFAPLREWVRAKVQLCLWSRYSSRSVTNCIIEQFAKLYNYTKQINTQIQSQGAQLDSRKILF